MHSVTSNAVANKLNTYMNSLEAEGAGWISTLAELESMIVQGVYAPACFVSHEITDGPGGDYWYNFFYIPHRNGIGGDNYLFGCLFLFDMTQNTNNLWICHYNNGTWYPPRKISA